MVQVSGYNFSEKYRTGGVIGVLASDTVELGAVAISNASLGIVTEASVDLTGASCAGVLVSPCCSLSEALNVQKSTLPWVSNHAQLPY